MRYQTNETPSSDIFMSVAASRKSAADSQPGRMRRSYEMPLQTFAATWQSVEFVGLGAAFWLDLLNGQRLFKRLSTDR